MVQTCPPEGALVKSQGVLGGEKRASDQGPRLFRPQIRRGIFGPPTLAEFEIEFWAFKTRAVADKSHRLPTHHALALAHQAAGQVAVNGVVPFFVVENDDVSKPALPSFEHHPASARRRDRHAQRRPNVDSV